jgi:hypothetical protein
MTSFNAYHFTGSHLRDGRPVPAIGETLVHDGPIIWCESGLYASRDAFDALRYAPGAMLHRVLCEEIERDDKTKLVCRRRTIVASIDATDLLRSFARSCALDVIDLWNAPDVVRQYLETGDESLRAAARDARDAWAAWDARDARAAAWTAAVAAAVAAAEDAWTAARDAARNAVWAAVWAAAWTAARNAAQETQRARFNSMVDAAFDG